ncbi:MAG: BON domain-containing protein [Myxococcota bacterium]
MVRVPPTMPILVSFLALAVFGLSACGGDDGEARLRAATETLETALADVEQATAVADERRAEVEEARKELAVAEQELAEARRRLSEAKAEVDADATDTLVFRSVQRRLLDDEALEGVAIAAQVQAGVVTLSGEVPDAEVHERALEIARETPGVVRVQDRIRVLTEAAPSEGT